MVDKVGDILVDKGVDQMDTAVYSRDKVDTVEIVVFGGSCFCLQVCL